MWTFIDLFAGVGVCSVGHSHPHFVATVTEQLQKVSYFGCLGTSGHNSVGTGD